MTDLDPYLAGCDRALAEAERLLTLLAATGSDKAALTPVRATIARLRREVDRLRGLKVPPARRESSPFRTHLADGKSPWQSTIAPSADPV